MFDKNANIEMTQQLHLTVQKPYYKIMEVHSLTVPRNYTFQVFHRLFFFPE